MALTGFLEKKTQSFVEELWTLLADAQSNPTGISTVFLEKKKSEILKRSQGEGKERKDTAQKRRWEVSPPRRPGM